LLTLDFGQKAESIAKTLKKKMEIFSLDENFLIIHPYLIGVVCTFMGKSREINVLINDFS
jgi:hypothetical protein